jgi:hypothetical protein
MRAFICICVSLMLIVPQLALADKQKSGGGSKAAAHPGGGGGSRAGAHPGGGFSHPSAGASHAGGSGMSNHASMGQHNFGNNNPRSGGHAAHTQNGLNAHQQSGQHGLNSHQQAAAHGLKAPTHAGLQNNRAAKLSPTHPTNNHLAGHNQAAGHWRSGLHYQNTHALYAGYHRVWHDRGYWRSHYSDVVYVGGPYWGSNWYWDGGY